MSYKWDIRFLKLAEHIAAWSKDPSTKVGAVITDPNRRVVSLGYNGLPQGILDIPERMANRDLKYQLTVHAERNAILFAQRPLFGCTLYTWPFMSCSVCAAMIIQCGIVRHVAPECTEPRWLESMQLAAFIMNEAKVELKLYPWTEIQAASI